MEFLGRLHPAIVHAPIAFLIGGALFELIGLLTDLSWWRRAAFAMLVIGTLAAWTAVLSGREAEELDEKQHVPEAPIEAHEEAAILTAWLATAAVLVRATSARAGRLRPVASGLALGLHLAAAVTVGITGYRGGELVFEHAAGVHSGGQPVQHPHTGNSEEHD